MKCDVFWISWGEVISQEKPFSGKNHFRGKAIYWGEAIFGEKPFSKTLLPLPCKDLVKKPLTLIQEESDLLVKNVPNHFLRRSHFPVHCSLFNKRKSVVSIKNSTFSLLTHFCLSPLFSSNMSLSMFWLLRRSLTTILQRIIEWRKESLISNSSFLTIVMTKIVNIISNDFFS